MMVRSASGRSWPVEPDDVAREAAWAEASGFDSVWVGDHVVHHGPMLDTVVAGTMATLATKRVQVGIGVLQLALRGLVVPAKQMSSLAYISGGRLLVGVGVGGEFPAEWEAAGVPLKGRGQLTDEYLRSFSTLVDGGEATHRGSDLEFGPVSLAPVSSVHVPVLGSGRAPAALCRAAAMTDGWLGFLQTPRGFERAVASMAELRAGSDRAGEGFLVGMVLTYRVDDKHEGARRRAAELVSAIHGGADPEVHERFVVAGPPEVIADDLRAYIQRGASLLVLNPVELDASDRAAQLDRFANDVQPLLRS